MAYQTPFLEAIKVRRSILSLAKESPISDDRIVMCGKYPQAPHSRWMGAGRSLPPPSRKNFLLIFLVNHAIKHAPSPFNVQSCRAIVLFGAEHEKLWDIGMEESRKTLPPPVFAQYEGKIQGYRDAYGTVSHALSICPRYIARN
jgi:predicted oxidoreductase (fatty acid repression mutant protein)